MQRPNVFVAACSALVCVLISAPAQAVSATDPLNDVRFEDADTGQVWHGAFYHDLVKASANFTGKELIVKVKLSQDRVGPSRLNLALGLNTDKDSQAEYLYSEGNYLYGLAPGLYAVTQDGYDFLDCHYEQAVGAAYTRGIALTIGSDCGLGKSVKAKGLLRDEYVPNHPSVTAYDHTRWSPAAQS